MTKFGKVFKSEKGNLYVQHSEFKTVLRLYAEETELKKDKEFRNRLALREGEYGFYVVLANAPLEELDL